MKDALSSFENLLNAGRVEKVNALWACATLKIKPSESLFQAVGEKNVIDSLGPTLLSNFLWVFAAFDRMPDDELLQKIISRAEDMTAGRIGAINGMSMLKSFGRLSELPRCEMPNKSEDFLGEIRQ